MILCGDASVLSFRACSATGLHKFFESLQIGKGGLIAGLNVPCDTLQGAVVAGVEPDDERDHGMSWKLIFWLGIELISHARQSNRRGLPGNYQGEVRSQKAEVGMMNDEW
jgi:hypothetical protein